MTGSVEDLVPLFGSSKEIARVAKVDKSAVVRWRQGKRPVAPLYQRRIWREAKRRDLDLNLVGAALDMPWCPTCKTFHEPSARRR